MVSKLQKFLIYIFLIGTGYNGITKTLEAQSNYDFLISLQSGFQHTGYSSKDTYINKIEMSHGRLISTRVVNPIIVGFELYHLKGSYGAGFGLENERYSTRYEFIDESIINVSAAAIFHNILFKYKYDLWEPFIGIGIGTYTATVFEQLQPVSKGPSTRAYMIISNTHSYQGKLGVRFPILSVCGIMFSIYSISAPISVPTEGEKLELGGDSAVTGLYCLF